MMAIYGWPVTSLCLFCLTRNWSDIWFNWPHWPVWNDSRTCPSFCCRQVLSVFKVPSLVNEKEAAGLETHMCTSLPPQEDGGGRAIRDHVTTTGAWEGLGLRWVPIPPVRGAVQDCGALGTGKGSCSPGRVDKMDFFILPWTFGGSWRNGWGGHCTGPLRKLVPLQGMNLFSSPLLFWGARGLNWGCVL